MLEDSAAGIASGRAAGFEVLTVRHPTEVAGPTAADAGRIACPNGTGHLPATPPGASVHPREAYTQSERPNFAPTQPKKKAGSHLNSALPLLKELVRPRRGKLALGFLLMVIGRLCSLVLPGAPKYLVDNVINQHQIDLLKSARGRGLRRHHHSGHHIVSP